MNPVANVRSIRRENPTPSGRWVALDYDALWGKGNTELRYVVPGLLGERELGIVASDTGAGKTYTLLSLAVAVASGLSAFRHFRQGVPSRVVYVDAEVGYQEFMRRLEKITKGMGADEPLVRENIRAYCQDWPPDGEGYLSLNVDGGAVDIFHHEVREFKPVLVILDTFIGLFGGDENDNHAAREWYSVVVVPMLRDPACSIILSHHFNKDQGYMESRPALARLRGASDIPGFSEKVWTLQKTHEGSNEFGTVVEAKFTNCKARRGDLHEALTITIQDTSPTGTTVTATPCAPETSSAVVETWLREAGATGMLRQDIASRLAAEGYAKGDGAADKAVSRALKLLKEADKVKATREGNATRYCWAEAVPKGQQ